MDRLDFYSETFIPPSRNPLMSSVAFSPLERIARVVSKWDWELTKIVVIDARCRDTREIFNQKRSVGSIHKNKLDEKKLIISE